MESVESYHVTVLYLELYWIPESRIFSIMYGSNGTKLYTLRRWAGAL